MVNHHQMTQQTHYELVKYQNYLARTKTLFHQDPNRPITHQHPTTHRQQQKHHQQHHRPPNRPSKHPNHAKYPYAGPTPFFTYHFTYFPPHCAHSPLPFKIKIPYMCQNQSFAHFHIRKVHVAIGE